MEGLTAYIPADHRQAMAQGRSLAESSVGTALFADISGFTPLTESLARTLGPLAGAEALTQLLDRIYGALIAEVNRYHGSVVGFSGDAITCWFDGDAGARSATAAAAMQEAMRAFARVPLANGDHATLSVKVALARGPVRRFVVGNPGIQRIDVLAGRTLDRLAAVEKVAEKGEIVADESLGGVSGLVVSTWRETALGGRAGVVAGVPAEPPDPWPEPSPDALDEAQLRAWVLPIVFERSRSGPAQFLADFRPAAALFLSFSGLDYDDDPAAGTKLDRFIRRVQAILQPFEGTLVQLTTGDKGSYLYAAFGAPVAHRDDAVRAVNAARMLQQTASEFEFIRSIRIGLAHGSMYAGAYGSAIRRTYGVLGDKTNLAARLMGRAADGEILCDEEIVRHARQAWRFDSGREMTLKGKIVPVLVRTPLEPLGPGSARTASRLLAREAELERIEEILEALPTTPAQVLFIEGEPGLGKSNLVKELTKRVRKRSLGVLHAAGDSVERQTPYRPWRDILVQQFGLEGLRNPQERRGRVAERAAAISPALLERLPLLNDILDLGFAETALTEGFEPSVRQQILMDLVVAFMRAQDSPLVIVLEDVHWLDSLSWELAAQLARSLQYGTPSLLLVLTHTPFEEALAAGPSVTALQTLPGSSRLELKPLPPEQVVALATEHLGLPPGGLPPEVAGRLRERAGGNPLFAEELIDGLRERGLLRLERDEDGTLRCSASPELAGALEVLPDTLHGVILSRLDRMQPERQLTLKVAAVIGRAFAVAPLAELLQGLESPAAVRLPGHLAALTQHGLLAAEPLAPEATYLFRHVLMHQVAYQTLLFAQRRKLHQAVAEWYEARLPDRGEDASSLLAHHWSYAAEGSEDDGLIGRALEHLGRVGDQRTRLCAYPEAESSYRRALELIGAREAWLGRRAELLVRLGSLHEKTSDYARAEASLRSGYDLARQAGESATAVQALTELCLVATRQGAYQTAQQTGNEALASAREAGDRRGEALAHSRLGIVAAYQGDFDSAVEHFRSGLALNRAEGDRTGIARCLNSLGVMSIYRNDFPAAVEAIEEALKLARERGARDSVGRYLANLGLVAEKQRDFPEAARYYRESLAILEEIGARQEALVSTLNLGDVETEQGQDREAGRHYRRAVAEAMVLGATPLALHGLRGLAFGLARSGEAARAAELLGLVRGHAAYNAELERHLTPALELVRERLPEQELNAALARGEALELGRVVEGLGG